MLIVKRLIVEPRINFAKTSVKIAIGLTNSREYGVVVHKVLDAKMKLICISREAIEPIFEGSKLRISKPVVLYKSCNGEAVLSLVKKGDLIEVRSFRELCPRKALPDGFCPLHKNSEYRNYLLLVFGRTRQLGTVTGLAKVPHMVYTMYIGGPYVKVGIANGLKNVGRLYEQVFLFASILGFVENAEIARRIELSLSSLKSVSERFSVRERVSYLLRRDPDLELRSFITKLVTIVIPKLKLFINVKDTKPIPVITFSKELIDAVKNSRIIHAERQLEHLEGLYEVLGYAPGGLILCNVESSNRVFIPYQVIRNLALNIHVVR